MTNEECGLSSLLNRNTLGAFFKCYDNGDFLHVTDDHLDASELFDLSYLQDIESLIDIWPEAVNCYLPGVADEVNSQKLEKQVALEHYALGRGLFFDDPNRFDITIEKWLRGTFSELGLSQLTYSRSLVYAIAKGGGTSTHFDQNINIVLQIKGTKKWSLAKNTFVTNPMTRFALGSQIDPELESYAHGKPLLQMPVDATEIELKPGDILFLPRGMWHKTEALGDSISLNFTFSSPTWIDLLTSALRARLAQSNDWRSTANFVNDPKRCHEAQATFDQLLNEFKEEFSQVQASDILGMTEFNPGND